MSHTQTDPGDVGHLGLVAEMARAFADSGDIDATLGRGLSRIVAALGAEAASIFLLDGERGELVCRACEGPVDVTGLRLDQSTGIVGRAVSTRQTQLIQNVRADPDFHHMVDQHTGMDTKSVLAAPMNVRDKVMGAIELVNKAAGGPFTADDARLLEALAAAAGLAVLNARLTEQVIERERLRREIDLAAAIQRAFLPADRSPGFPVHGRGIPARQISGDCYDVVERADGSLCFFLADVAGKGVNAAPLMAKTASLFHHLAKTADTPEHLVHILNGELCETATHGLFVTTVCGIYEPATRALRLVNAGHLPGLVMRAHDQSAFREKVPAHVPPLGIDAGATAGIQGTRLDLSGARLYIVSDGIAEALATPADPDGEAGVADAIARAEADHTDTPRRLEAIMNRAAPGDRAPADDLTILVVTG